MNPDDDKVDYALELAKHQGVSVTTVKDGWVFLFTENTLQALLTQAKNSGAGQVAVFVQSSDKAPAAAPANVN